jgi:hypothetical protein
VYRGAACCSALLVVSMVPGADESAPDALGVSSSVRGRVEAVRKGSPKFIQKKLDAMATLLAQEELYNAVSNAGDLFGKKPYNGHKTGFSAWMSALSNRETKHSVEKMVRERLLNRKGGYGNEIWKGVPAPYHNQLPALATQAAHEATSKAFQSLRYELIEAGEWDKGYLPGGHSLIEDPLTFDNKYKGDKKKLGHACKEACGQHEACRGYTFNPSQGVCYLKTMDAPSGGFECDHDCWYWGKYAGHEPEMKLSLADAQRDLGLKVTDLKVGTGPEIKRGGAATMGYIGTLSDGTVFDKGQYTFTFGEGQVIKGDDIGLQGLRVGGKRRLVIPPSLAYGRQGYPGSIPPDATIRYAKEPDGNLFSDQYHPQRDLLTR